MKKIASAISAVLLLTVASQAFAAGDDPAGASQGQVRTDLAKLRRIHPDDDSDRSSWSSDDNGDDDGSASRGHDSGDDGGNDHGSHDGEGRGDD